MSAPLKISRILRKSIAKTLSRSKGSLAQAQAESKPWLLHGAACLMRYPVISKDLSPLEQKYENFLKEMEVNRSYLSDFEVDVKEFERKQELRKKGLDTGDMMESETELFKTVDLQVKWEEEDKQFTPASRHSDPEVDNNMQCLNRRLDRQLVLIVKQVFSEEAPVWGFPQFKRQEGQSMREAAEQALEMCSGGGINSTFLGNAPCGYFSYKLPKEPDYSGVKVFFFKALHKQGNILDNEDVEDYKWVTHDELADYIHPRWMPKYRQFLTEY